MTAWEKWAERICKTMLVMWVCLALIHWRMDVSAAEKKKPKAQPAYYLLSLEAIHSRALNPEDETTDFTVRLQSIRRVSKQDLQVDSVYLAVTDREVRIVEIGVDGSPRTLWRSEAFGNPNGRSVNISSEVIRSKPDQIWSVNVEQSKENDK